MLGKRIVGRGALVVMGMAGLAGPVLSDQIQRITPRGADARGNSAAPVISDSGQFVAYVSGATGLFPGHVDRNGVEDVFLYDRITGQTVLVSRSAGSAVTAANGRSADPTISRDGNYVLFLSRATNLVPGQTDSKRSHDVFLWSRLTGKTVLVSRSAASPVRTANAESFPAALSADGSIVAFTSQATNLLAGQEDSPGSPDIFLYDRRTGAVTLASHAQGQPKRAANGGQYFGNMSPSGEFIAFASIATNLAPGAQDDHGEPDIFLYTRSSGQVSLVNPSGSGESPYVSANGRFVAYLRWGPDGSDLVIADRAAGTSTQLNDVPLANPNWPEGRVALLGFSDNGRFALVMSPSEELVPGVDEGWENLFLFDRVTGEVRLASHQPGSPFQAVALGVLDGALSANGRSVVFTPLKPGLQHTKMGASVLLYDRLAGDVKVASHTFRSADEVADRESGEAAVSSNGLFVVFTSRATNLVRGDSDSILKDVFFYTPGEEGDAVAEDTAGDFIALPACKLLDTRTGTPLASNKRLPVPVHGACGVPHSAQWVTLKVTVTEATGKGNIRLYPGTLKADPAGLLRFQKTRPRTARFTVPMEAAGTCRLVLLPFVAGGGTAEVVIEAVGYSEEP